MLQQPNIIGRVRDPAGHPRHPRTDHRPAPAEINAAITQLGRLISDDPAHRGVAEVIWSALRGMVLVEMIVNEHLEWQDERRLLVEMVTRYLQDG